MRRAHLLHVGAERNRSEGIRLVERREGEREKPAGKRGSGGRARNSHDNKKCLAAFDISIGAIGLLPTPYVGGD